MGKIALGVLLGAVLGALDGATAWFTPEVRAGIIGIIIGSTVKGMIAGVAAGWFAKKVQNLWAGIVFGLVVGALLAYGIVLMQKGKYFVAIMLPGTCVGAICGFATQRYGSIKGSSRAATAAAATLFLLAGLNAHAETPKALTSADAFARLKALDGTWKGKSAEIPELTVTYHVTGGGTTVQETLFPGTPHEMITMYTLDGGDLVATHYCAAGNQPSLRYNPAKSSDVRLIFDFVAVRGPSSHGYMHDAVLELTGADTMESQWNGVNAAGKDDAHHHFSLTRAK